MASGRPLFYPSPQMLSHMCSITRVRIKPQDCTVLNLFYLSFARDYAPQKKATICLLGQKIKDISLPLYGLRDMCCTTSAKASTSDAPQVERCSVL